MATTAKLSDIDASTLSDREFRDLDSIMRSSSRSEVDAARSRLGVADESASRVDIAIAKGAANIDAAKLSPASLEDLRMVFSGNARDRLRGAENLGILIPSE